MTGESYTLRPFHPDDAPQAARLHAAAIETGLLSSLGTPFLTSLYRLMAADPAADGCVAVQDSQIVGFAVYTADLHALYRSMLRRGGLRFMWRLAGSLFSWRRCRRILETLLYPRCGRRRPLPRAELLVVAVRRDRRREGIGRRLVAETAAQGCREGWGSIKVCVGGSLHGTQAFYRRLGFEHACDIRRHGRISQIWIKQLAEHHA
jgi:ribosomal protein S18 acetylase RimI-like enzyme